MKRFLTTCVSYKLANEIELFGKECMMWTHSIQFCFQFFYEIEKDYASTFNKIKSAIMFLQ